MSELEQRYEESFDNTKCALYGLPGGCPDRDSDRDAKTAERADNLGFFFLGVTAGAVLMAGIMAVVGLH
jgi:hypothetical protein